VVSLLIASFYEVVGVMGGLPSAPVGLLAAVDSGLLPFGGLWDVQREILAAVERCPQVVNCLGRRSSKTTIGALSLLWMATCRPDLRRHVLPGEQAYFVSIASNREQARVALNQVRRLVRRSSLLRGAVRRETDDAIELVNDNIITTFVCSARSVRGFPVAACLLDELAWFVSSEDGPAAASEVWKAITPSLAQFGGEQRLIVSSTPNGANKFKQIYDDAAAAVDAGDETVAVFHRPTWLCNPRLPEGDPFYERERRSLGEAFGAEYGARFLGSGNALLAESDILACIRPGDELGWGECEGWVCGADFAWRRDRSAAVVVGRVRDDPERLVVGAIRTYDPPKDLAGGHQGYQESVLREVAAFANEYRATIFCDPHESATVRARLQRLGARVEIEAMGVGRKGDVFKELARRVRSATVSFPDHPILIGELRRLRVRYGGQHVQIENPRSGGGHGDVANALALAVARADSAGGALAGAMSRSTPFDNIAVARRRYGVSEFS
jgi:hypothetical protein